ncbi:DUF6350 family protein [Haloactinopolyspora sp.]|uniref:cell division protein PerM n=1 Tax=Haloactinopolyspora sp. TaxID=1966353 RepID=UPI002629EB76|nr:DUF6350 family protein [Haloactinopolyspora sp.]
MADLLTRPLLRRDEPAWGSRVPWLAAIVAAGWALIAGFAMSVLPGVAVWISEGASQPLSDPLRFGARVWLAAHRIGLDVDGAGFTIAPLGLTIAFVLLLHRSARWAAHSAGVATTRGLLAVTVPAVLTYALGAGIVAGMSATSDVAALPLEAVAWAAGWSAAAVVVGAGHEAGLLTPWFDRLPSYVQVACVAAAAALAGLLATGAVLSTLSVIVHADQVGALAEALDAGALGASVLIVGSMVIMPNAVIWAVSFALGPGFAVGTGTSVAPGGVELAAVPAVPALGALPSDVPGAATWLVVIGPLAAGALAGLIVCRRLEPHESGRVAWATAAGVVGGAAVLAGAGMAGLALLSGGSAGAVRLTEIGPVFWQVGVMTVAFVAVAGNVVVAMQQIRTGERISMEIMSRLRRSKAADGS